MENKENLNQPETEREKQDRREERAERLKGHRLAENIARYRKERGYTQGELAEMVGYGSRSSINKIESGQVDLSLLMIEDIAEALGVSPERLTGWVDEKGNSAYEKEKSENPSGSGSPEEMPAGFQEVEGGASDFASAPLTPGGKSCR